MCEAVIGITSSRVALFLNRRMRSDNRFEGTSNKRENSTAMWTIHARQIKVADQCIETRVHSKNAFIFLMLSHPQGKRQRKLLFSLGDIHYLRDG